MRDLLVVVLTVAPDRVVAGLGEVDRPGRLLREVAVERPPATAEPRGPAVQAAADALAELRAGHLGSRLLALAVAVEPDAVEREGSALRTALGSELPEGWGLPATLPVVHGSAQAWTAAGAVVAQAPLVAGAVVTAARAVGAHAHLPRA